MRVCAEATNMWIYGSKFRRNMSASFLPCSHRVCRKKTGRRVLGTRIPLRVRLHERNTRIETRRQIGHGEADTVIYQGTCVHAEVENTTTCVVKARSISTKNAADTLKAQYEIFSPLPPILGKLLSVMTGLSSLSIQSVLKASGSIPTVPTPTRPGREARMRAGMGSCAATFPEEQTLKTLADKNLTRSLKTSATSRWPDWGTRRPTKHGHTKPANSNHQPRVALQTRQRPFYNSSRSVIEG